MLPGPLFSERMLWREGGRKSQWSDRKAKGHRVRKWKWLYSKRVTDGERVPMDTADGVYPVLSGKRLLSTPHRQAILAEIRHYSGLPDSDWSSLYGELFEVFAALIQEIPGSQYHHHARRGGLLDHSLEVCLNAMKLFQAEMPCTEADEPRQHGSTELRTYAVASAALIHDAGKVLSDQTVCVVNTGTDRPWFPWMGPMRGRGYRTRFNVNRQYSEHSDVGLLLAPLVVPEAGLNWIGGEPALLDTWVSAITGRKDTAEAKVVQAADRLSVKRDLRAKQGVGAHRPPSISERFVAALKRLISDRTLILNRPGAVGWLTDGTLWLVAKTSADMVRDYWSERGQRDIPSQNPRLFTLLQEERVLLPNQQQAVWRCCISDPSGWTQELSMIGVGMRTLWAEDEHVPTPFAGSIEPLERRGKHPEVAETLPSQARAEPQERKRREKRSNSKGPLSSLGEEFVTWIKKGIRDGTLSVNETTAKIHIVDGGVFLVSPGIFRAYLEAHPEASRKHAKAAGEEESEVWVVLQKVFQQLRLHRKTPTGHNIWTCRVKGAKASKLRGYWLKDSGFWPGDSVPADNPHLLM